MPPEVDAAALRSWSTTGLVAGWVAVAGAAVTVVISVATERTSTWVAVIGLAAVVSALVAYGYLRRVWSEAGLQDRPEMRRLRWLFPITANAYGAALLANVFLGTRAGEPEAPPLLVVVSAGLAAVALTSFIGVLVVAHGARSLIGTDETL